MGQGGSSTNEDDSECVQRKRLKRIEADVIRLKEQIESLQTNIAEMKRNK